VNDAGCSDELVRRIRLKVERAANLGDFHVDRKDFQLSQERAKTPIRGIQLQAAKLIQLGDLPKDDAGDREILAAR
jgi:hypothetical protein